MLVPAHVLEPNRSSRELRHQRRRLGGVVAGRAVAERARALPVLDADLVQRQAEQRLQLDPHRIGVLGVGHDERAVLGHVADRAARADRHVPVVLVLVGRGHGVRGRPEGLVDVPGLRLDPRRRQPGGVELAHLLVHVAAARDRGRVGPLHLQLRGSLDRRVLLLGDDADEVAEAHDLGARDRLDRALVHRQHLRSGAVTVGALPTRPHHAAVQHVRHLDVLHVGVLARHLVRDVDPRRVRAHDLVLGDRFRPR